MVLFKRIAFLGEYLERNERYPRLIVTCFRILDFTSYNKRFFQAVKGGMEKKKVVNLIGGCLKKIGKGLTNLIKWGKCI